MSFRVAENTERLDWLASPRKNDKIGKLPYLFDPRLGIKPPPRLCALERSGRDNKMAYSRATEGAKGNRNQ